MSRPGISRHRGECKPLEGQRATAADLIQKLAGARQTGGLKQRQAADRLGGIETTAHQELEALLGIAEMLADYGHNRLAALAKVVTSDAQPRQDPSQKVAEAYDTCVLPEWLPWVLSRNSERR
jgi:hypothetical protein